MGGHGLKIEMVTFDSSDFITGIHCLNNSSCRLWEAPITS